MTTADETRTVALTDYAGVIARRWRVVAGGTLVGILLAVVYALQVPRTATATAVVNVTAITTDPFDTSRSAAGLVDMETEAQAVQSMAVAESAARLFGDEADPRDIRQRLIVSTPDSTTVMRISVSAASAQLAQAQADAVATAYLEHRSSLAADRIERVLGRDAERLETMRAQLSEANARLLLSSSGTLEAIQAETDRELLILRIDAMLARTSSLEGIDTSGGQVLTPASSNAVTYSPRRAPIVVGGVLAGFVLGLAGAFVREAQDPRVRHGADVAAAGLGPVVAEISDLREPLSGADAEQVEVLRETLLSWSHLSGAPKTLALVEDRSVVDGWLLAAALARKFGHVGIPVDVFVIPTAGSYEAELDAHLGVDGGDGVDQPSGQGTAAPPVLFQWLPHDSAQWQEAVREHADGTSRTGLVLLVCPARASDGDRMTACRLADAAVLCLDPQVSLRARLRVFAAMAETVRCPVLGTIFLSHSQRTPAMLHDPDREEFVSTRRTDPPEYRSLRDAAMAKWRNPEAAAEKRL